MRRGFKIKKGGAALSGKNSENFKVCYVLSSHCTFVVRYLEFYITQVIGTQIGKEAKNAKYISGKLIELPYLLKVDYEIILGLFWKLH